MLMVLMLLPVLELLPLLMEQVMLMPPWPPKKQPAVAAAEAEGSRPQMPTPCVLRRFHLVIFDS